MYQLKITEWFSAGHQLKGYHGKCEEMHGHNFKVELLVEGKKLDATGLMIDFKDLKEWLGEILEELDHKVLNQVPAFSRENPSSENIARYLFKKISPKLPRGVRLTEVWVWESENAGAAYRPDKA